MCSPEKSSMAFSLIPSLFHFHHHQMSSPRTILLSSLRMSFTNAYPASLLSTQYFVPSASRHLQEVYSPFPFVGPLFPVDMTDLEEESHGSANATEMTVDIKSSLMQPLLSPSLPDVSTSIPYPTPPRPDPAPRTPLSLFLLMLTLEAVVDRG